MLNIPHSNLVRLAETLDLDQLESLAIVLRDANENTSISVLVRYLDLELDELGRTGDAQIFTDAFNGVEVED